MSMHGIIPCEAPVSSRRFTALAYTVSTTSAASARSLAIQGTIATRVATWSFSVYTPVMSIDRILISLGILLLIVSAVLAAITWLF